MLPVDTLAVFRTLSVRLLIREVSPNLHTLVRIEKKAQGLPKSMEQERRKERESGLAMTRVFVGDSLSLAFAASCEREWERGEAISLVCGIWLSLKVKLKNVCSSQMNVCFDENTPFAWMSCCEQAQRTQCAGSLSPLSFPSCCTKSVCACSLQNLMHKNQVWE